MTKETLENSAAKFVRESPYNYISAEEALSPDMAGLRIYDEPIWGYADAHDPLFHELQKKGVVGPQFMLPEQWLPSARSVISFFMPFSDEVKKSNYEPGEKASTQWLHARIEGQRMVMMLCKFVSEALCSEGYECLTPCGDSRFRMVAEPRPELTGDWADASYTSNWSERHVAYVSGLGTFALSKGMITEKGIAGRFGSVVVSCDFEPKLREYTGVYDYCIRCGACVKRCPVGAISLETGKNHAICSALLAKTHMKDAPYYGCGKCQTKVPCESRNPLRQKAQA